MSQSFWNRQWSGFQPFLVEPDKFPSTLWASDRAFLDLVGRDVAGKHVLDLGCGNGIVAVFLAKKGAIVTAIDSSAQAIANTGLLAKFNKVDAIISTHRFDVTLLERTLHKQFDLIVGRFILHHLEPFAVVPPMLSRLLVSGGRAVFLENNARNPLLMLSRKLFPGRFGIPKHSDEGEYPLQIREVRALERAVGTLTIHYPEFMFFILLYAYLFPQGHTFFGRLLPSLDDLIYGYCPFLRKYSYRQIIEVQKGWVACHP